MLSIKSLEFNPQFKETDWLKQNRIFVISASINLRTYLIAPPDQPMWDQDISSDGFLTNGEIYDTGADDYNLVHVVETTTSSMNDLSEESFHKLIYEGAIEESKVLVNYLRIDSATEDSVRIIWEVENSNELESIKIKKSGEKTYLAVPVTDTTYTFTDLTADSEYKIYVKFTLKSGVSKRLSLLIRTREASPDDSLEDPLIGLSW